MAKKNNSGSTNRWEEKAEAESDTLYGKSFRYAINVRSNTIFTNTWKFSFALKVIPPSRRASVDFNAIFVAALVVWFVRFPVEVCCFNVATLTVKYPVKSGFCRRKQRRKDDTFVSKCSQCMVTLNKLHPNVFVFQW